MSKLKEVLSMAVSSCKEMGRSELGKAYNRLLNVLKNSRPIVPEWKDSTEVDMLTKGVEDTIPTADMSTVLILSQKQTSKHKRQLTIYQI